MRPAWSAETAERRFLRLKGLFSKGYLSRFRFRTAGFIVYFGSAGKSETAEHAPIFPSKTVGRGCP